MKNVKNIIIGLLLIVIIVFIVLIATNKIQFNLSNSESNNPSSSENSSTNSYSIKAEDYLGYWFENELASRTQNPTQIKIKSIDDNTVILDLYVARTVHINDLNITLSNGKGNFSSKGTDNIETTYEGNIEFKDNQIVLEIQQQSITLSYHAKFTDLSRFIGEWFETSTVLNQPNANRLNILSVSENKIKMNFYITRTFSSEDFEIAINDEEGRFSLTPTEESKVEGTIKFYGSSITLNIKNSTVPELSSGSEYTFTYKK